MQNSALNWCSDHRLHHKYTDTDADPYNAGQGFWWSHIGWIFYQSRQEKQLDNVGDLKLDPLVMWQYRYDVPIALVVGFVLPTLMGGLLGRAFGMLLWAGLIRVVFVHHATFSSILWPTCMAISRTPARIPPGIPGGWPF